MSQGLAISIKRLCLCLVNKTASRLKKTVKTRGAAGCRRHSSGAGPSCVVVRLGGRSAMMSIDSKTATCALKFVGRVIASIPCQAQRIRRPGCGDIYVYAVREIFVDSSVRRKVTGSAAARFNKEAGVSHNTGFEMLRATLNLARGNIEDQVYALLRQAVLPTRRVLVS